MAEVPKHQKIRVFVLLAVQGGEFPDKREKKKVFLLNFKEFKTKTKENKVNQTIETMLKKKH